MRDEKLVSEMTIEEIRECMGDLADIEDAEAMRDVLIDSGCGGTTMDEISEMAWLHMMDRAMESRESRDRE